MNTKFFVNLYDWLIIRLNSFLRVYWSMLLMPKRPKYLKSFSCKSLNYKSKAKTTALNFSFLCLKSKENGYISNFQVESIRRFLKRYSKNSQIFFRFFPSLPITKKPNEVRLGCGKGGLKYWTSQIRKNEILLEFTNATTVKRTGFLLQSANCKIATKSFFYNKQERWIL